MKPDGLVWHIIAGIHHNFFFSSDYSSGCLHGAGGEGVVPVPYSKVAQAFQSAHTKTT